MMSPEFAAKLEARMSAYRAWERQRHFSSGRLVKYCGVEMIGAQDVVRSEVENYIKVAVQEGYHVEWTENESRLYLCIWEPWNPPGSPPDWSNVFAESDLDKSPPHEQRRFEPPAAIP
jgi:hypothetical protein